MKMVWLSLSIIGMLAAPAAAGPNCRCRANGQDYQIGQLVCLHLPEGERLARCSMVLNNSSWTKIEGGCPTAFNARLHSKPRIQHHTLMSFATMQTDRSGQISLQTLQN